MTKYSNRAKKPDQYVKGLRAHWKRRRTEKSYNDKRDTAVNECWRPAAGASKADLAEFHGENMGIRRAKQLAREPHSSWQPASKSDDPAYRKSIWPKAKIDRRAGRPPA